MPQIPWFIFRGRNFEILFSFSKTQRQENKILSNKDSEYQSIKDTIVILEYQQSLILSIKDSKVILANIRHHETAISEVKHFEKNFK